ncbi:MAG: DNA polymerase III subunit delta' [Rhizobiaceae bacterium]
MADLQEMETWDRLEGLPDPAENRVLIGHDGILDQLAGAHASGRMHHAWLITGPAGIGKATLACRFAGHLFRNPDPASSPRSYVQPPADDPVESRVARGGHPNLLHLRRGIRDDGKFRSQLTIEEVRKTVSFFGTSAGERGYRVCIVDTADDLNRAAANALLKVLEEPPPRTIFLVLAHASSGVLPTIRSRCVKLTMRPLGQEDILSALDRLGVSKGLAHDDLHEIARLSSGSVRRAIILAMQNGAGMYRKLVELVANPSSPDWGAIHLLASELAPVARNDRYQLFLQLVHDYVGRRVRAEPEPASAGQGGTLESATTSELARWVEVWEKTRRSAELANSYNLDRKQVILNFFEALRQAA